VIKSGLDEMGGTCNTHGRGKKFVQNFSRKPERKRLLIRPKRGWEDNIRMGLAEIGRESVDWLRIGSSGGVL
jgi:hypothetical protein